MDLAWWTALCTPWSGPLNRSQREILLRILFSNSLEFRVTLLKNMAKTLA